MRNDLRSSGLRALAGIAILSSSLAGCGGDGDSLPREAISGTVTLDGQPLAEGVIQLLPASQKEGVPGGAIIKDGKFSIEREKGLTPGEYRVIVNSSKPGSKPVDPTVAPGPVEKSEIASDLIPPQYNTDSKLTAEVKAGSPNTFEFALKSK